MNAIKDDIRGNIRAIRTATETLLVHDGVLARKAYVDCQHRLDDIISIANTIEPSADMREAWAGSQRKVAQYMRRYQEAEARATKAEVREQDLGLAGDAMATAIRSYCLALRFREAPTVSAMRDALNEWMSARALEGGRRKT